MNSFQGTFWPAPRTDIPAEDLFARRLIWLFLWLWIFEGSLRKWILPEFNAALLVIRDPVLLLIYAQAAVQGKFPGNGFVVATGVLGVISFAISMLAGDISGVVSGAFTQSLQVTLYGVRTNFLFLPLIWVIPIYFDREDVLRIGWWLMLLSPAMALLVLIQFQSPSDSWINVAAGGEGRQIETSLGKIRPPGTFSYTNGLVSYLTLIVAYLCYELLERDRFPKWLAFVAACSSGVMLALSGSRSAVGACITVILGVALVCVRRPEFAKRTWRMLLIIFVGFIVLNYITVTRAGFDVLEDRFGDEENIKRGFIYRFLYDQFAPFIHVTEAPLFGYGLGVGTNAGSALLVGKRTFLLSEGDIGRAIFESGPILGLLFIVLRFGVVLHVFRRTLDSLAEGQTLALLLFSSGALTLATGQIGQPTALGFAVFSCGIALAAIREVESGSTAEPEPVAEAPSRPRGRSVYAEQLHGPRPPAPLQP
ncbi:MAG: hypothetical protein JSR82_12260 [Verrucomicrobia bacterium]|nr:hypothetical protein [Verrucomicrobiota bacterium]